MYAVLHLTHFFLISTLSKLCCYPFVLCPLYLLLTSRSSSCTNSSCDWLRAVFSYSFYEGIDSTRQEFQSQFTILCIKRSFAHFFLHFTTQSVVWGGTRRATEFYASFIYPYSYAYIFSLSPPTIKTFWSQYGVWKKL